MDDASIIKLINEEFNQPNTIDWPEYNSLVDKEKVFGACENIKSTSRFLGFLNREIPELTNGRKVIFRGLSQAKYRLLNAAQRAFKLRNENYGNEKLYHELIETMIDNARKVDKGVLVNFFKDSGLQDSDVAVLSFLQHYGAPTPFMDWTSDIYVALYFAVSGLSDSDIERCYNNQGSDDIEDYFSVYMMIEDQVITPIHNVKGLSLKTKKILEYSKLKKKKLQYIDEKIRGKRPAFSLLNNLRITNQKGLFIYNNSSNLPIEEVFKDKWRGHWLIGTASGHEVLRSPLVCLNIHKSIAYHLKNKMLNKLGYTETYIFPTPERIASQAIPDSLRSVI